MILVLSLSASAYLTPNSCRAATVTLRAYIAKQTKRYEFPDKKFVNDRYTHDLTKLLSVSGLEPEYRKEIVRTPNFEPNWTIVKDWSVLLS